jgi:hypothetical protein
MSFTNMLNMPDVSGPMDFGSMDNRSSLSGNTSLSSTTFFDGSLLSPINVSLGGMTTPGTSTGSEGQGTPAYTRRLEQELLQAKRELASHK